MIYKMFDGSTIDLSKVLVISPAWAKTSDAKVGFTITFAGDAEVDFWRPISNEEWDLLTSEATGEAARQNVQPFVDQVTNEWATYVRWRTEQELKR